MKKIIVIQELNVSCREFKKNGSKMEENENIEKRIIHGGISNQRNWENEYLEKGYIYKKAEKYEDLKEADIIFFDAQKEFYDFYSWWKLFEKDNLLRKIIVIRKESEAVDFTCGPKTISKIQKAFPIWMTYQDDIVNNINIFKGNISIPEQKFRRNEEIPFSQKKLCIMICANKRVFFKKNELYSERRKIISYYEKKKSDDFQLYGVNWSNDLYVYNGSVKNKRKAYDKGKFAICLENSRADGYITEKIFDCLINGIVPIYGGAYNISDYIPKECYIDYFSFASLDEMNDYLKNMPEEVYNRYLRNIERYINSQDYKKMAAKSGEDYEQYSYPMTHMPEKFYVSLETKWKMFWSVKVRENAEKMINCFIDKLAMMKKKMFTK